MTTLANTAAEACRASGSINNRRQISKVSASRSHRAVAVGVRAWAAC